MYPLSCVTKFTKNVRYWAPAEFEKCGGEYGGECGDELEVIGGECGDEFEVKVEVNVELN
jgi:hypothetical protein